MTEPLDHFAGLGVAPPTLDSTVTIDATSDVGPLYLHRDDAVITPTIVKTGCWEPEEAVFLTSVLRDGGTFIDVGANIGYFTLLASAIVGPSGRVFAVEPEPRNVEILRANVWRNRAWNVRILPLAAQAETGYVGLRLSAVNRGDHQVVDASTHTGALVPAARLDELLDGMAVDVVKIDVQGVDHQVVEGLEGVLAQNPKAVLMCEFWLTGMEERGIDPRTVIERYAQLGLRVGLLGYAGAVSHASADEVVEACRVGDNDFVNVVLTSNDSEIPMLPPQRQSPPLDSDPAVLPEAAPMEAGLVEQVTALAEEANRGGGGYHVLRPLPGVVVNGEYDMTPLLPAYHLPDDLAGNTVLDVGTASGFFAMECARRGAKVTAIDLVLWDTQHWQIAELMNWDVRRVQKDIYELDPTFGPFDIVICGSLLLHLPDPLGAIRRLRGVCKGRAIVSTSCPEQESELPICEFAGELQEGGAYWAYWNISGEALRRMLLAAGFDAVENQDHFTLTPVPGHAHTWSVFHAVAHGVVSSSK
jgi:FkbM family methyltransferase